MDLHITDLIADNHIKDFNSNALEQVLYGGRASYKSSRNAIKIALKTLEYPCEVVVVRENYKDHKTTTFADLKWAYKKLGINLRQKRHYPDGNDLYIKLPNGSHIHFKHMKDIDSLKGTRPSNPDNAIKIVWFYEITEMKSKWHIENAISGFVRSAVDWFWILYEFNPAPKLSHWTYDWLADIKDTDNTLVYKSCYDDVSEEQQRKFLGDIYLGRIHKLREIDPEQFKSIYKGLPANLSGTVYKQFDLDKHIQEPTYNYDDITIGVDFGGADATVFSALGWVKGMKGLEHFSEYYHKNGVSNEIKNINEYVEDFLHYAKTIHEWWGKAISVYIDPANLTFKQLIEEKSFEKEYEFIIVESFVKRADEKGKSSVQERVDLTEIMWGSGFLTVAPHCKQFIKATQEAEYNNNNERADDGRSNIDSLDAFEYSWLKDKKLIKDIILG